MKPLPPAVRARLDELGERYDLAPASVAALEALLAALAAEPDPPTTARDPEAAVEVHVADSLSALELGEIRSARAIADLGAGAGFPGLVLGAALRDVRVDLVESARRKCDVIDRLAAAAGLAGRARAVPARAEEWAADDGAAAYDAVVARAVASLAVLVEYAAPLLGHGGVLVAWKGARDAAEERAGRDAAAIVGLEPASVRTVVPYEGSRNHHLHLYSKVSPTPERFPRRPGAAAKRPLA